MSYSKVIDNQIVSNGNLPATAQRLDNGAWVMNVRQADVATQEACGWYRVVRVDRPADDPTKNVARTIELVDGVPTTVWTETDKTQDELDADAQKAADQAERDQVRDIVGQLDTYLEIGSPTAAQTRTQVDRLTRAVRRLIKDQYGGD